MTLLTDDGDSFTPTELFLEIDHPAHFVHLLVKGLFFTPSVGFTTRWARTSVAFQTLKDAPAEALQHAIRCSLLYDLENA